MRKLGRVKNTRPIITYLPEYTSLCATASRSQRSFSSCPACPLIQQNSTSWTASRSSNCPHRSGFSAGLPSDFFQPRFFQPCAQPLVIPSTTYLLSVVSRTLHGYFSAERAFITPESSMRLLVVCDSPPESSFSLPSQRSIAPQPPGPGFPLQAPSVKISTSFIDTSETNSPGKSRGCSDSEKSVCKTGSRNTFCKVLL